MVSSNKNEFSNNNKRKLKFIKRKYNLDGDTIILTDLTEMINLNMNNNIVMGFLDNAQRFAK